MNNEQQQQTTKERLLGEIKKFEKSPWTFLIRKSKLTILIIVSLLIFGLITIRNLPRELNPEIEIPIAVVLTVFPGASPLDVEEQVTKEIENEISDLSGVKKIDSTSSLGVSSIVVEFEAGEDLDQSIEDLKEKVDFAKTELPSDVPDDPQVIEISFDDESVITATLTSDRYDVADLKQFAENIEDRIKGVGFVSDVVVVGGRDRVIKVDVDQEKLANFGLSINQVINTLNAANINFPIGSIDIEDSRYNIRVEGEFQTAFEVANLQVASAEGGAPIYLEDVAQVRDDFSKEFSRSRFSVDGSTPTEAVSIQVFKRTGGDVTKLTGEVRKRIEDARGEAYPDDVTVEITNDFSVYISESIGTLMSNGGATVLIIFVLLLIFLGWKEALLAGPAIPFSFFISFIFMAMIGESINFLSLFALVLSLGLLVDSAVVIVEGMYNKVQKFRFNGYQAAISTIHEYAAPLLSGMLTTVAAFFPILFVQGIFGQFMKVIPTVVIATLIAGLFVSLSIVPAIGTYIIKPSKKKNKNNNSANPEDQQEPEENSFFSKLKEKFFSLCKICRKRMKSKPREHRFASKLFDRFIEYYNKNIPRILTSKRKRRWLIGGAWILFFVSLALPISGLLKIQAFTVDDAEFFFVNLEMPNGTVLERTSEVAEKIEKVLQEEPEVINFVTNVGASVGSQGSSSSEGSSNRAFFQVNLTDDDEREIVSSKIVSDIRGKLEPIVTEGTVTFLQDEGGPPTGKPVELRVSGPDLLVLEDLAEQIKTELAAIPTTIEVETSLDESSGEFVFVPNKEMIAANNLSVLQIAAELRNGVARDDSIEITKDGEEIEIDLGIGESRLLSFEDVRGLVVTNGSGETYSISELGQLNFEPALASIVRRDNERVVVITSDTDGGNPSEITAELQGRLESLSLPTGYFISFGGEAQELQEVYTDMLLKMVLGIVLIIFILVLQFNSYRQASIILFTIPLAMIGVLWGMTIFRLQLDIPAFIGIVSLTGIVVNNAIILIDQMNRELRDGKGLIDAARSAGCVRMRPIFLTTITTIAGLLPLSLTQPIWRNLGFSIIFGLAFSTMLTLIMIPTLFVSLYKKKFGVE